MLGTALLAASRNRRVRTVVTKSPLTRRVVTRFIAGDDVTAAVGITRRLTSGGFDVTLDHLGEDTFDRGQAEATRDAYLTLIKVLADQGLSTGAEASLKLSAMGQALPGGASLAADNAAAICAAAAGAGMTVTLDMEDHTTVDSTLGILAGLRKEHPWVGVAVQAMLYRTEADCRDLATTGSRVRLVKGAYAEPKSVAYPAKADVDRAYVRCLDILMSGLGHPMVATHDPRMIAIAQRLAVQRGKSPEDFEFQMLYGIRTGVQEQLRAQGNRMRIYVPYGDDWYGYFMRRLAERPANVAFLLRALTTR
ncbi:MULTISPECIES: proline dehydrogenase family protein [Kribbella]|uniref:proline dehydrogenase n=1 Tax=Kribbella karoonensis TaxID=324851 RepID=A0ABN2E305_9ACTN